MDTLFTTSVIIHGESKSYSVSFADDAYIFNPEEEKDAPLFRVRREADEWKVEGNLSDISKQQAASALDHYLLSQH